MPAEPPLTPDERRVLAILMEPNRPVAERTVERIAAELGTTFDPAWRILRSLERRQPQLAHPDVDAGLGVKFWRTTYDAAEAMEGETG
jgi:hypothetical protein